MSFKMSFILPREIRELWRFASVDEARTQLGYVELSMDPDGRLCGVATDGHMLARVRTGKADAWQGRTYLHAKGLQALRPKKHEDVTLFVGDTDVAMGYGDTRVNLTPWDVQDKYPDWRAVLATIKTAGEAASWGMDLRLIDRVYGYLKKLGADTCAKVIAPDDVRSPMRIVAYTVDAEITFVLMPCMLSDAKNMVAK